MDDTKKLIEKYKRELMELGRRSAAPAPARSAPIRSVPVVPDEPEESAASETVSEVVGESVSESVEASVSEPAEPERAPRIIGYVNEESGEFPAVYDRFLAELVENDESLEPADIDGVSDAAEEPAAPPAETETPAAPASPRSVDTEKEVLDLSDVLFTPPYRKIPSTKRVREEITERSDPAENYPAGDVSGVTDNSPTAPLPKFAPTESVPPGETGRLTDQPISGTSSGEQLTGRSFEDESYPNNPDAPREGMAAQGSRGGPVDYPVPVYGSFEEFERKNAGRGTILFRVYTAQEAMPIAAARCVISKTFGGKPRELYTLITDSSGQTRAETLPAPSKELSQSFEDDVQPFALYDASVNKEGFAEVILRDIPVFDGVQSIQRVSMIPAPGGSEITEEITEVDNAV